MMMVSLSSSKQGRFSDVLWLGQYHKHEVPESILLTFTRPECKPSMPFPHRQLRDRHLTFPGRNLVKSVEDVGWVDHLQLALSHRLAHLPQLPWQVLGQWRGPAGAIDLGTA